MLAMSSATVPRKMLNRLACPKRPLPLICSPQLSQHAPFRGARLQPAPSQNGYTIGLSLDLADPLLGDKIKYAKKRLHVTEPVHFELSAGNPPSEAVMGFLRLRELIGMDAFLLKPLYKDDVWNITKEPGSLDNERAVCERMAKEARDVMASYPSTIQADSALLQGGSLKPGSQEEAAVKARLKELQSLDATAKWFEQRAAGLADLSYYQERWRKVYLEQPQ